jgi:hypothetical protein
MLKILSFCYSRFNYLRHPQSSSSQITKVPGCKKVVQKFYSGRVQTISFQAETYYEDIHGQKLNYGHS